MRTYKLIGTKLNETPDAAIIRCANNLVKAVLASGRSMHCTPGLSGIDVEVYAHCPDEIQVRCILSGWSVCGKTPLKVTFAPRPDDLAQDDAPEGGAEHGRD